MAAEPLRQPAVGADGVATAAISGWVAGVSGGHAEAAGAVRVWWSGAADGGTVDGVIYTYVPRPASIEAYERARDNGTAGIRRTYWDQVDAAFAAFSVEQVERYRASTPDPDIPVIDLLEARER